MKSLKTIFISDITNKFLKVYYKESEDGWTQIERYQQVFTEQEKRKTKIWKQKILIADDFTVHLDKFLK